MCYNNYIERNYLAPRDKGRRIYTMYKMTKDGNTTRKEGQTMIQKLKQYHEEGNAEAVAEIILMDEIPGINDEFVEYLSKHGKRPEDWEYEDLNDFTEKYLKEKDC